VTGVTGYIPDDYDDIPIPWQPWEPEPLQSHERPTWQETLAGLALCVLVGAVVVVNVARVVLR
jgi:hypothetical protein